MEKLLNNLVKSYSSAYPDKNGKIVQVEVSEIWRDLKKSEHVVACGSKQIIAPIRPQRVAARRQRELMCQIKNSLLYESEEYEWLDEENVETDGLDVPEEITQGQLGGTPIITVSEALKNPWSAD